MPLLSYRPTCKPSVHLFTHTISEHIFQSEIRCSQYQSFFSRQSYPKTTLLLEVQCWSIKSIIRAICKMASPLPEHLHTNPPKTVSTRIEVLTVRQISIVHIPHPQPASTSLCILDIQVSLAASKEKHCHRNACFYESKLENISGLNDSQPG